MRWLKNCGKRRTNFFSEKEDFHKNGHGYDFETFTNGFLAKNCIRISRHLRTKIFSPKLEIGYTVNNIVQLEANSQTLKY